MNELDKVIDELIEGGKIEFYEGNSGLAAIPGGLEIVEILENRPGLMAIVYFWVVKKHGSSDVILSPEICKKLSALSKAFGIKQKERRRLEVKQTENENINALVDAIRKGMKGG